MAKVKSPATAPDASPPSCPAPCSAAPPSPRPTSPAQSSPAHPGPAQPGPMSSSPVSSTAAPHAAAPAPPRERPYFIPASVDYASLPPDVQLALAGIVEPAYKQLVERAMTGLERAAGVSLVFLLTLEVLDQFKLARDIDFTTLNSVAAAEERNKQIDEHLRLLSAKQASARFMLRLHRFRNEPFIGTMRRDL